MRASTRHRCGVLHAIGATAPDIHAQAGLGAWWNKMLKTKAVRLSVPSMASTSTPSTRVFFAQVAALKGKGKKLMPGEHNKAW